MDILCRLPILTKTNCMRIFPAALLITAILPILSLAQSNNITGTVVDSLTRQPMAFVSVTIKETKRGGLTDIDGHFSLKNVPANSTIVINYIGYRVKLLSLNKKTEDPFVILISRRTDTLEDVVVRSDLNPAHRIIRLMQQNKKRNDPVNLPSYAYNAYTMAALGATPYMFSMQGRLRKPPPPPKTEKDSIERLQRRSMARQLRDNYLFITESYTERIYKYPKLSKETVLATRVSGINDPLFAVTSANFQPFGFYLDYLRMPGKVYTSPVVNGSINMYKFNLREVLPHEKDTTYVISFEPLKGKNFDGLRGILYINSDGWAIENVTAAPADDKGIILGFRLQQKYEQVDGHWFPVQLNTYLSQKDVAKDSVLLYWDTRSYIKNIAINKPFTSADFSDIAFEFAPGAGIQTEAKWQGFRVDSLQPKEKATYSAYDSMPKSMQKRLNSINTFTEVIALQAIPSGVIDIPIRYLISGVNQYEKIRLGFGLQTNTKFSKWFSVGGYGGYGFGDKAWKYGSNVQLSFNRRTNTFLRVSFSQDLQEPGNIEYFKDNGAILSNQSLRNIYTSRLDSVREWKALFSTRPWHWLQTDGWLLTQQRNPAGFPYRFDIANNGNFVDGYNNTEIGIGLRYTRGETYARIGRAKMINTPARTQIMLQLSKGLNGTLGGQLDYTKLALQVNHSFRTKHFGNTAFQAELGQVWGNVPYAYLFNTKGSVNETGRQRSSGLFINNSFQTAGVYEFTSNRTASLFIEQNFGSLLFKPETIKSRPEFVLVQNIGYGTISNLAAHQGVVLQAPEKGLYESGLLVRNILRTNMKFFYYGFGIGVFRRYGYYTLEDNKKNWALKFGVTISF